MTCTRRVAYAAVQPARAYPLTSASTLSTSVPALWTCWKEKGRPNGRGGGGGVMGGTTEARAARRDDRSECCFRDSPRPFHTGHDRRPRDGEQRTSSLTQAGVGRRRVASNAPLAARFRKPDSKGEETGRARADRRVRCIQTACNSLTVIAAAEIKHNIYR